MLLILSYQLPYPKSSLLTLVSAFMGYDIMTQAYKTAIERKYNFLSYGDSMYIS